MPIHFSNLKMVHHIMPHSTTRYRAAAKIKLLNADRASPDPKSMDEPLPDANCEMDPSKKEKPTQRFTSKMLEPNALATAISIFICLATMTDEMQSGSDEPMASNVIPNKLPGMPKHSPIFSEQSTTKKVSSPSQATMAQMAR